MLFFKTNFNFKFLMIVVVVVGFKSNCPRKGHGSIGGMPFVRISLREPLTVFTRVSEKTTENSKRLVDECDKESKSTLPVDQF